MRNCQYEPGERVGLSSSPYQGLVLPFNYPGDSNQLYLTVGECEGCLLVFFGIVEAFDGVVTGPEPFVMDEFVNVTQVMAEVNQRGNLSDIGNTLFGYVVSRFGSADGAFCIVFQNTAGQATELFDKTIGFIGGEFAGENKDFFCKQGELFI